MTNPVNYKTKAGLLKALKKHSQTPMSVSLAWWFKNAEYTLVKNWGYSESEAAKIVATHLPTTSIYKA